jgi:hypothetical protein
MQFFKKLSLVFIFFSELAMADQSKTIYGYIEKAILVDKQLPISAKLDTGAKSASLNARAVREVNINGKPYLNFIVPDKTGDKEFTCEYIGEVKIKIRSGESRIAPISKTAIRRPVVRMAVRLGDQTRAIRVNLTNRKRFNYPLLLGREALIAFNGIVDPALKFTLKKTLGQKHENH